MAGRAGGRPRVRTGVVLAAIAALGAGAAGSGLADETGQATLAPRWHLFFGLDSAQDSFFGHAGLVWAPFGDLHRDGWLGRAAVNGGEFSYLSGRRDITGRLVGTEVLAGYQWLGPHAGVTAFAGPVVQDQTTDPYDPGKPRQGTRFGGKVLLEGWLRPAAGILLNASGSYSSAAETYTARLSANVGVGARLALEPEFVAFGEPGYDQQRYGILLDIRPRPDFHMKVGGGWALEPDGEGPYGAFQVKVWR